MQGPTVTKYDVYNTSYEKPLIEGVLFLGDVLYNLKISKASFYREIKKGLLPKGRPYFGKSVWFKDDIESYINKKLNIGAR